MKHLTTNRPIPIFAGDRYLGFVVQTKKGGHEARDASGACIGGRGYRQGAQGALRSNADVGAILGVLAFFLVIIVLQLNLTGVGRKPK